MKTPRTNRFLAGLSTGVLTLSLFTAPDAAAQRSIAFNFTRGAGQETNTTTPKGPTGLTHWNDQGVDTGDGATLHDAASGTITGLTDHLGNATTASISWTSANMWGSGSGTGGENEKIVDGYLDDGGNGVGVTVSGIPFAKYNVYGIVASDQGGQYDTLNFTANGQIAFQAEVPMLDNQGSLGNAGDTNIMQGTFGDPGALAGVSGRAVTFTRAQQALAPYNAALNPAGAFSVEVWLKPSQSDGATTAPIASFREQVNSDGREGWLIYEFGDRWNFRMYNKNGGATSVDIYSTDTIEDNRWYHIVATWDGSVARLYVDGVLNATSAATTYVPNSSAPFALGSRMNAFSWAGSIDHAAVYPVTLDATKIAERRANGIDANRTTPYSSLVLADNPLAYWNGQTFNIQTPVNGQAFGNWIAAGQQWTRINPRTGQRGNFFRISGLTGGTLTLNGGIRAGAARGSLAGLIIEESIPLETLTRTGADSFGEVSLGAGLSSVFRPGIDVAEVEIFSVNATHSIQIEPVAGTASGTYPLISYADTIGAAGFAGLSVVPSSNPRYSWSLVDNAAEGRVDLAYTAATDALVWTAATDSNWDSGTVNWKTASANTPTAFFPLDEPIFNDTAANGSVVVTGTVQPLRVTVNNSSLPYQFSGGGISGGASILKLGAGSLSLQGANTFTGPVEVRGGTLSAASPESLGASSGSLILHGGTLAVDSSYTLGRRPQVTAPSSIQVAENQQLSFNAGFTGGSTLRKTGPGTLRFAAYGSGGFAGDIDVQEGTLAMAGFVFNGGTGISAIRVRDGATLLQPAGAAHALGGYFAPTPELILEKGSLYQINQENYLASVRMAGATIQGSNEIRTDAEFLVTFEASDTVSTISASINTVNAPANFRVENGPLAVDAIVSGVIGNSGGGFNKFGPGTLEIPIANTYAGPSTIHEGTLLANNPSGSAVGNNLLTVAAGATLAGSGIVRDVNAAGTIAPGDGIGSLLIEGNATLSGTLAIEINGAQADFLEIFGIMDLTGSTLSISTSGTGFSETSYVIAEADEFIGLPTPPPGYSVEVVGNDFPVQLVLTKTGGGGSTSLADWLLANAPGQTATDDHDGDGVANGVEFFMGQSGSGFTANPAPVNGKITWPKNPNAAVSYVVQTSTNLAAEGQPGGWTTAPGGVVDLGNAVEYTLPNNGGSLFVRLKLTFP